VSRDVRNFVWTGGRPSGDLDLGDPAGRSATLCAACGQFGLRQVADGIQLLARDALGVNKLFFALAPDGTVHTSSYWIELLRAGFPPDAIWSVPSGHWMAIDRERRRLVLERYAALEFGDDAPAGEEHLERHARRCLDRLREVFGLIAGVLEGRRPYVTLSGGLDSTTVAVLAREVLGGFTAVTFSVDAPGTAPSDDFRVAERVARDLGAPFEPVLVSAEEVVGLVDAALLYGQDWREFNVHCALVNAAVARHVARRHPHAPPLLLTGDVMNELMVDYAPESYAGREYYRLPELSVARLRRILVAGLDAGDREIGVFHHFGVEALQPYAMCAAVYAALPAAWLERPAAKAAFVRRMLGDRIPEYVYRRPKVRAQVGSAERPGGTLAVLADRGIDGPALARRFGELFAIDPTRLTRFLRAGFYRFPTRYPGEDAA
jgi:asparagine synthetase B (glutamine-hydrolysing)